MLLDSGIKSWGGGDGIGKLLLLGLNPDRFHNYLADWPKQREFDEYVTSHPSAG